MSKTIQVTYYTKGVYAVRPDPDNPNFEYLLPTEEIMYQTIGLILKEIYEEEARAARYLGRYLVLRGYQPGSERKK